MYSYFQNSKLKAICVCQNFQISNFSQFLIRIFVTSYNNIYLSNMGIFLDNKLQKFRKSLQILI